MKYYVYLHKEPLTGEVMYVGKGTGGRAWDVTRCRSGHREHQAWMLNLMDLGYIPSDWVIIHKRGLSESDAFRLEKEYLHTHRTLPFNRQSGERNFQAKLTDEQARFIYLSPMSVKKLSEKYKVSRAAVHMIKTGKQWRAATACIRS